MPERKARDAATTARKALGDRGYALHLTTEREGETLLATVELEDVESQRPLLRLVAAGCWEGLDLTLGLDLGEEEVEDLLRRLRTLWDSFRVRVVTSE